MPSTAAARDTGSRPTQPQYLRAGTVINVEMVVQEDHGDGVVAEYQSVRGTHRCFVAAGNVKPA